MLDFKISKKRAILITAFLAIYIIGTVLIFTFPFNIKSTYGLTTTTDDGVTISFNVFEPVASGNDKKAVIIGHGSMANKEMMKSYAIELAAAGFVAIPFDFRGHGQSTGDRSTGGLIDDIEAIKEYLNSRSDVDINNLGYIGLSMGGVGQQLIQEDSDFKCFIGTATWLYEDLRRGNTTNPLNILMIHAKNDEIVRLSGLKESLAIRTGIPNQDINVNKLYGSFENGNASMIYLDDNANHIFAQWDTDFVREARNWVINTFPDVIQTNEDFNGHIRLLILVVQLIGGLGFFFLIIKPMSETYLIREDKKIELQDRSLGNLSLRIFLYSIVLAIPGILIMLILNLPLSLAIFGFVLILLFGQAFALFLTLLILGKKSQISALKIIKLPFKMTRENFFFQLILGLALAGILYAILYSSIGLNFFGFVPSITKLIWVPVYFLVTVIVFIFYGLMFQMTIQSRLEKGLKNICKVALLNFAFVFLYMLTFMLVISLAIRSFYYFGFIVPLTIPVFLLTSFVWAICYEKSGNILVGAITSGFFLTMMIGTSAQLQTMLSFLFGFIF